MSQTVVPDLTSCDRALEIRIENTATVAKMLAFIARTLSGSAIQQQQD
jgi:hypothetical protein